MSSAPRILQVVLSLNPGGTERLVVEIVRRLHPELAMAVCCLDEEGSWGEILRTDGIEVTALRRAGGFRPSLGRHIAQCIARHRADVVHCHHYSPFVYGSIAKLWHPRLRIVFTEHGRLSDGPPSAKRRAANRILSRVPHEVLTVSADLREHLIAEGFPAEKVKVVYNGINVGPLPGPLARARVRRMLGIADEALVVGTVARLDSVKDLGTLIRAVPLLSTTRAPTLLIVGDGSERAALEEVAREAGAAGSVRFLGHRDDARELLSGCDVYANSSISEGVSLTILEAMAAGLPVVATRVGGTPEIVDTATGRLVAARDPQALGSALSELAANPGLQRALGTAGRARVEQRFTIERMVRDYRASYCAAT